MLVDELRGLSPDLPLPGIFVRSAVLRDLVDSLVSDLLKDGYESRLGPVPVGVCEPDGVLFPSLLSFEGALPILTSPYRNLFQALSLSLSDPSKPSQVPAFSNDINLSFSQGCYGGLNSLDRKARQCDSADSIALA